MGTDDRTAVRGGRTDAVDSVDSVDSVAVIEFPMRSLMNEQERAVISGTQK